LAELSTLERRLTDALDRVGRSFEVAIKALNEAEAGRAKAEAERDALASGGENGDPAELAAVRDELDRTKAALETERAERLALAEDGGGGSDLSLIRARSEIEDLHARLADLESGLHRMKLVNAQLRQNNRDLRKAHEANLADAGLVNTGLQAEIDALTAVRSADRTELDSILAALKPMIEETVDA
jgi:hypothetical protein